MLVSSEAVAMPLSSSQLYAAYFDSCLSSGRARSRLIPPDFPPLALEYPEALSSIVIRTAEKLLISPSQLIERFILPGTDIRLRGRFLMYGRETYAINGVGKYAGAFLKRLDDLLPSGRHAFYANYAFLTPLLGPAGRNVVTTTLRWCTWCLQEAKQPQRVYYPLYWLTHSTQVCIRHKCFLHTHCGFCRKEPDVIAALSKMGHCNHCQTPLWENCSPQRNTEPSAEDVWKAEAANQLIQARNSLEAASIVNDWQQNLDRLASAYPSTKAAERALGLSETLLKRWRGRNRPCLPQLIDLAFKLETPPHDLLSRPIEHDRRPLRPPTVVTTPSAQRQRNESDDLLEKAKAYMEKANDKASIKGLCRSLGISEGAFRYHWPSVVQDLAHRSQESRQLSDDEARQALLETTLIRLATWYAQGKFVGTRQLRRLMADYRGFKTLSHRSLRRFFTYSRSDALFQHHLELLAPLECGKVPSSKDTTKSDPC